MCTYQYYESELGFITSFQNILYYRTKEVLSCSDFFSMTYSDFYFVLSMVKYGHFAIFF